MKKIKAVLIILAAVIALPALVWYAAVPDSSVEYLLASNPAGQGLGMEATNFHKGFFFSFGADALSVKSGGKAAVVLGDVRGRINPLALLLFRLDVPFRASLAGGTASGFFDYGFFSGKKKLIVRFNGVQIGDLPPVKGSVSGILNANLVFSGEKGNFLFTLDNLGNFPYGFKSANGVAGIMRMEINIESVSLDSPDTYAKVKGKANLENGAYNLRLEVTKQGQNPDPLLSPYQQSPGYYVVPLSGNLRQLL